MNCGITRWKIRFWYRGRCCWAPVVGSDHALDPFAKPMKFSTVFGAVSGKSWTRMSPRLVTRVA
jgi:hypothetical protein